MAFKSKLKSLIIGGRQDSLQSPSEETISDILTVGAAAVSKGKVLSKPVNPHEEQEIIDGIESSYYNNESFDTSLYELQKLSSEELDLDMISNDCDKLKTQLQAVSKRISELILQNHPAYATELQRVMDLQKTLKSARSVCQVGRRHIDHARESFTIASLGLLSNYRKRQQLNGLLKSLRTIKTLQRTDLRLREMMEEEDYSGAIQLCLECQKAASTFRHYTCISELSSKLQDTLEMIEEQLDVALSKTCTGFEEPHYRKVQRAYSQLGKTQTAMDQLHMHFASAIHNTAFTIILGYVELTSGSGGTENFQKRQYTDLCKHITIETFTPCLVDLCKALWGVLKSYYKTMKWHETNDKDAARQSPEPDDGAAEVEASFNRRYVNQKLEYGRVRVWQDIQQKVRAYVLASDLSGLKLDEFILVLDIVNRMIEIGDEFCGSKSEALQDSMKQQSLNYFKTHHRVRLEELHMFLENEAWEVCPVKSNFNILQLMEFRFMRKWANSRQLIPESEVISGENNKQATEGSDQEEINYFSKYLADDTNPFDKPVEEEENEDVFSGIGETDHNYGDSDSDSDIPDELKKDYIDEITGETHSYKQGKRRTSSRGSKAGSSGPLITNTTINVLRVMGKYLQMISFLKPIAFEVISCMSQLFDYYLFTVHSFFGSDSLMSNDKTINQRLFTTLQRIRDNLISQPYGSTQPGMEPQEGMDKIPPASMAPHVNLTMSSNLYGLAERVVATESLMFLVKQLDYLHPYLEELIPANKKAFLSQFYSQTVHMASEVRKPVYSFVSSRCVAYDVVLQQMGTVRWDVREIMSQHSPYIDTLLQSFQNLKQKLTELERRVSLPRPVTDLLWEQCVRQANRTFVEGYANSKKCSHEGRALMQLDFQQFLTNIDHFVELKPVPEREFVEAYIKAYYLSKTQLEVWVHDHKEYSNKQLLSLINCVQQLDRKSRQKLVSMVEDMDRGRR
ncbi:coiled-coil domain containing 132 [Elysia marginata]|uniref:Coiled-coil domain containing 132 n=1 Tax=Elysia marginata TaxID=1093978 RepID=A0AAV4IS18_9GAST|nr:coiled-coil domain containing 132 [Elysia marginata]